MKLIWLSFATSILSLSVSLVALGMTIDKSAKCKKIPASKIIKSQKWSES